MVVATLRISHGPHFLASQARDLEDAPLGSVNSKLLCCLGTLKITRLGDRDMNAQLIVKPVQGELLERRTM